MTEDEMAGYKEKVSLIKPKSNESVESDGR